MNFNLITLFPQMFSALESGITNRALKEKLIQLKTWNPRDYTHDAHRTVDDRPYGGGPGMVMLYQPLKDTLDDIKRQQTLKGPVIYLSPQGKPLTQEAVARFSSLPDLTLLCGRYEGIDERFIKTEIDEEWSVGDYVVSGGELPAMLLIDAITRLLPGALGDAQSAEQDSFSNGLLDHPHYTRPENINGLKVPDVLLSGDHKAIKYWRKQQSELNTWQKRPDLIKRRV